MATALHISLIPDNAAELLRAARVGERGEGRRSSNTLVSAAAWWSQSFSGSGGAAVPSSPDNGPGECPPSTGRCATRSPQYFDLAGLRCPVGSGRNLPRANRARGVTPDQEVVEANAPARSVDGTRSKKSSTWALSRLATWDGSLGPGGVLAASRQFGKSSVQVRRPMSSPAPLGDPAGGVAHRGYRQTIAPAEEGAQKTRGRPQPHYSCGRQHAANLRSRS